MAMPFIAAFALAVALSAPATTSRYEALAPVLLDARRQIAKLELSAGTIESVEGQLSAFGSQNAGLLVVRTASGERALLKVYPASMPLAPLACSILLQRHLGEHGLAPRVHGWLPPRATGIAGCSFGLLMELIEHGWNPTRSDPVPAFARHLDHDRVIAGIRAIRDAVDRLRVNAHDPQFLVVPSGRVYYVDLDRVWWVTRDNRVLGADTRRAAELYAPYLASGEMIPISNEHFEMMIRVYLSQVRDARMEYPR